MALLIRQLMDSFLLKPVVVSNLSLNFCVYFAIQHDIAELEINIKFPTCWDGKNLESQGGVDHVVYSTECDGEEHNECFEFDCPASHPVKFPEVHLYVRVLEYEGGAHVFSDGTDVGHHCYYCHH